jgi:hypothetical protein
MDYTVWCSALGDVKAYLTNVSVCLLGSIGPCAPMLVHIPIVGCTALPQIIQVTSVRFPVRPIAVGVSCVCWTIPVFRFPWHSLVEVDAFTGGCADVWNLLSEDVRVSRRHIRPRFVRAWSRVRFLFSFMDAMRPYIR